MLHPISIVVWNIQGGSNPAFKRNFRELLYQHKPCMVALLETKLASHVGLKDEFGFDDFLRYQWWGGLGALYYYRTLS